MKFFYSIFLCVGRRRFSNVENYSDHFQFDTEERERVRWVEEMENDFHLGKKLYNFYSCNLQMLVIS